MAGSSPRIDLIEGNAAIAGALAQSAGVTTLVSPNKISVPYTTIVNRAQIPDIANDAGVSFGVNRIMTQAIYQLQDEFGPNGEPVWAALNDERGMIRFVGADWQSAGTAYAVYGQYALLIGGNATGYIEITFYGTGLNLSLIIGANLGVAPSLTYSVDGGSAVSCSYPGTISSFASARNYSTNNVWPIVSGLSLGLHTIKINATNSASPWQFSVAGFEILNTSSSTSLTVKPGSAVGTQKNTLAALTATAYNSGFESGTLGTRGGHVLVYLKSDGTVGKAVIPTDATSLTLASASHTNEEVIRTYSFREFGAGRTDDFSRMTSSAISAAFTLDDGTTTLVGSSVSAGANATGPENTYTATGTANYLTLTFIGTGLDIQAVSNTNSASHSFSSVLIDGSSVGSISDLASTAAGTTKTIKVVSGLPYGVHTVKFSGNASTISPGIARFTTYGPKKPTLPTGAVELADYYVMGNYTATSGTQSAETVSSGVIRKSATRELVYSGNWLTVTLVATDTLGFTLRSSTAGDYIQYTFFGTGFEFGMRGGSGTVTATVTIDGSLYTGAATALNGSSGVSAANWTSGTGTYTADTGWGSKLQVTGLSLGLHTVKITGVSFASTANVNSFDVITPIHSPKSNLLGDLQNTLPVGSQSLSDSRKFSTSQLGPQKAWAQALHVTSSPTTSSTTLIPCPDMSLTLKTSGGKVQIGYSVSSYNNAANNNFFAIFVNGSLVGKSTQTTFTAGSVTLSQSDLILVSLPAGVHKIDLYWNVNAGTATMASRILTAVEL